MSQASRIVSAVDDFFFGRISATGFGLMRAAWGLTVFVWMLSMCQDVTFYFSDSGLISPELRNLLLRSEYRFSILDTVSDPSGVWILYILLLTSALITSVGFMPRFFTIFTVILLFSFQERNLLPLGGGDTTLRTVGFILAICPELRAFSVMRLREQWLHWKTNKTLLPPLTMSVWPYRLLLWQAMIIYVYSGIEKVSGDMWLDGTAVEVFFHHPNFFRWSREVGDMLVPLSTFVSYFTLIFEFAWLLLLIPRPYLNKFPLLDYGSVKRAILMCGVLFHVGIVVLSDVGIFPLAIGTMYLGLLLDDDFDAMRRKLNRKWNTSTSLSAGGSIAVLYDGKCGLCLRSVFGLMLLDFLKRLNPVNFHEVAKRKKIAPTLKFAELDKAMHIVGPKKRTEKGFDAFRYLCWHIPALWIKIPVLYLPGVAPIGRQIYGWIAKSRRKCTHESCRI